MTRDQMYDALLTRGYHEDFLDEASDNLMHMLLYNSGLDADER